MRLLASSDALCLIQKGRCNHFNYANPINTVLGYVDQSTINHHLIPVPATFPVLANTLHPQASDGP
jgi:hypothetical protein